MKWLQYAILTSRAFLSFMNPGFWGRKSAPVTAGRKHRIVMNFFDILVIAMIMFSAVMAVFRGMVKETGLAVGALVSCYAAIVLYPRVSHLAEKGSSGSMHIDLISFISVYFLTTFLFWVLTLLITFVLNVESPSFISRATGVLLAFCKSVFAAAVLLAAFAVFLQPGTPILQQSRTLPYLAPVTENLLFLMPASMQQRYNAHIRKIEENSPPAKAPGNGAGNRGKST